jgi:hypothetical protein
MPKRRRGLPRRKSLLKCLASTVGSPIAAAITAKSVGPRETELIDAVARRRPSGRGLEVAADTNAECVVLRIAVEAESSAIVETERHVVVELGVDAKPDRQVIAHVTV